MRACYVQAGCGGRVSFLPAERCVQLLARRVARDEGAVQAGVPISFIAMLGG